MESSLGSRVSTGTWERLSRCQLPNAPARHSHRCRRALFSCELQVEREKQWQIGENSWYFALRPAAETTRNTAARRPPREPLQFRRPLLTRDDHVQLDGMVTQVFAGGQFEVKTDAGAVVRAQLSGRMRKNRIRVILGDRVTVALSPYDLSHGMITYRHK